ncbi:glycosyltransferase family 2 protein [Candidatus Shapirobacteria bacterium]|nr:glycosyltransferase family 2 protein [Candidatus Shapirobacteria bacterium]
MKQPQPLLSIIIVSYNTRELLEQCLNSVINSLSHHSDPIPKRYGADESQDLPSALTQIPDPASPAGGQVRNDGLQPHHSNPSSSHHGSFSLHPDSLSCHPESSSRHPDESQDLPSAEIIVVDNHSQDDSVEMLKNLKLKLENSKKTENLKLKIIVNNDNLGFAKANNIGIKKSRGEYLLFLNSDTIVPPKTISFMLDFMKKNPKIGVATCRVELTDGKLDEACTRGFPTPWNAFCHFSGLEKLLPHSRLFAGYYLGHLDLNTTHEIDSCVGAFMLVPRHVGEKIGWWDEDYFWYGEDIDFCYRVKKAGFKVMFVPEVKIIHYKGASSGIKKTKSKADLKTREKAMLASTQAMRIFYQKHYRGKYPKLIEKTVFWGINMIEKARVRKIKRQKG